MSMSMREALEYMRVLVESGMYPINAALTAAIVYGVGATALLQAYEERP